MLSRAIFLTLGSILFAASIANAAAGPTLTEAQAVQRASAFCQSIGVPVTASAAAAQFPAPQEVEHWQDRWRITFKGEAVVEVVDASGDASGAVTYYKNEALYRKLSNDKQPARNAISEAEAMRRASAALEQTGSAGELAFERATLSQIQSPPMSAAHSWSIRYTRTSRGVPFQRQGANVLLHAETGEIKILATPWPTAAPRSVIFNVGREQAAAIARRQFAAAGVPTVGTVDVQARIVEPNTFWEPGGSESQRAAAVARAGWVCRVSSDGRATEVWVDAEDGRVVGGSTAGDRGRVRGVATKPPAVATKPPVPPGGERLKTADDIRRVLRSADEVRIYQSMSPTGTPSTAGTPFVTLSKRSHGDVFKGVTRPIRFNAEGPGLRTGGTERLVILSKGKSYVAGYNSFNGLIMVAPNQFAVVDDKTREWLRVKAAEATNASATRKP